MRHDGQAAFKAFVESHLYGMVVVGGIASVVAKVLRPSKFLEERFPLIGGEGAETIDIGLIGIIVATDTSEDMRAFGANVGCFHRHAFTQLALHSEVPGVDGGEADGVSDHKRSYTIGQ